MIKKSILFYKCDYSSYASKCNTVILSVLNNVDSYDTILLLRRCNFFRNHLQRIFVIMTHLYHLWPSMFLYKESYTYAVRIQPISISEFNKITNIFFAICGR